jgi:hypothetical protein
VPITNPLDENQVHAYRQEVLTALRNLAEGQVPFLVGVRRLAALAGEMRERDRDLDLLVAIESETDHLPNESAKAHCSAAWLKKCEEEERQVEAFYRTQMNELCAKLTARFSGHGPQ